MNPLSLHHLNLKLNLLPQCRNTKRGLVTRLRLLMFQLQLKQTVQSVHLVHRTLARRLLFPMVHGTTTITQIGIVCLCPGRRADLDPSVVEIDPMSKEGNPDTSDI
jgi:hypothetical protein